MVEPEIARTSSPTDSGDRRSRLFWALALIATILVGWALRAASPIAVPVVFALFVALLVAPLDQWAPERSPTRARWLGHVVAMGAVLVALLIFVGAIWFAAQQVAARFPMQGEGAGSLLPQFGQGADAQDRTAAATASGQAQGQQDGSPRLIDILRDAGDVFGGWLTQRTASLAASIIAAAGAIVGATVIVFFLTLLMLIEGPRWRKKTEALLDRSARQDGLESVGIIMQRLRRYLGVRTVLGVLTAVLYVAWLWLFGINLLIVWALVAFLLNYIPTLGSLIAGVLPIAYAFVQKDIGTAVVVGIGIIVIEQVMGNYVDPRLQGRQLSLSSLVVLVALLFWGWLWGVAGAILAVPITISILVVAAHLDALRPIALLLSNETEMTGLDRVAGRSRT